MSLPALSPIRAELTLSPRIDRDLPGGLGRLRVDRAWPAFVVVAGRAAELAPLVERCPSFWVPGASEGQRSAAAEVGLEVTRALARGHSRVAMIEVRVGGESGCDGAECDGPEYDGAVDAGLSSRLDPLREEGIEVEARRLPGGRRRDVGSWVVSLKLPARRGKPPWRRWQRLLSRALDGWIDDWDWPSAEGEVTRDALFDPELLRAAAALAELGSKTMLERALIPGERLEARAEFWEDESSVAPLLPATPLRVDPYALRRELHALPIHDLSPTPWREALRARRREIESELDLIESRHDPELFASLSRSHFGAPSRAIVRLAQRLLARAPRRSRRGRAVRAAERRERLEALARRLRVPVRVRTDRRGFAKPRYENGTLFLPGGNLREAELGAVAVREIAGRALRERNGARQPFALFEAGFAGQRTTEEGLLVLTELWHDVLTPRRVRDLAARVVVLEALMEGQSFREAYDWLREEHRFAKRDAYSICERVYRQGGDFSQHLPLTGLAALLPWVRGGGRVELLWTGRVALKDVDAIGEWHEAGWITSPKTLPPALERDGAKQRLPFGLGQARPYSEEDHADDWVSTLLGSTRWRPELA